MFIPAQLREQARRNAARDPWTAAACRSIVDAAAFWHAMSDDDLWSLMFGPAITRSWHVWSNGYCPACKAGVPMYNWQVHAQSRPWKVRCPHCDELFPKNDFAAFHRSGLDERGVFDPARADRSLLYNCEHPDPADPLRGFGVDDGEGYVEGDKRWRFIGTYLIYGQWKQLVCGGINKLAAAYVVSGEPIYAHKAAVLLDRVADLHPDFDHKTQAVVYETVRTEGFVSTWHDCCEEVREMALAYDYIRPALDADGTLVDFLRERSRRRQVARPKESIADVKANIEEGILREAVRQPQKIHSNYPRCEICQIVLHTVLDRDGADAREAHSILDGVLERATAVDGLTGEKGLSGYTAFTIRGLAAFLAQLERLEPGTLSRLIERHPGLARTWRFHIDTWCLQKYYPRIGDTGWFAGREERYAGVNFTAFSGVQAASPPADVDPSMYDFLWKLYEITGDAAYAQVLYLANGSSTKDLPRDIFHADPEGFRRRVDELIGEHGATIPLGDVDKRQWHLAILRSGRGESARAAWVSYDAGGLHAHANGMNLGLFGLGLDLMPDLGYPPVQFGGWDTRQVHWYRNTPSHNTVVVDGRHHLAWASAPMAGRTSLWAPGDAFRMVRATGAAMAFLNAPEPAGQRQYERTVALIDVSDRDFYMVDVFRVAGGRDHAKFQHGHFGSVTTEGLRLSPAEPYDEPSIMRNFRSDPGPAPGWHVDWKVEDRYGFLAPGADVHVRYTDLTPDAEAVLCEGWVTAGGYAATEEVWIPRLIVRRRAAEAPLASTFVAVVEPYEGRRALKAVRRLPLVTADGAPCPDANVAVEAVHADGRRDLLMAADVEDPLGLAPHAGSGGILAQPDWGVRLQGQACFVRKAADGSIERMALCRAALLHAGEWTVEADADAEIVEIVVRAGKAEVVAGDAGRVKVSRARHKH